MEEFVKVAKVVLGVLVAGAYLYVLLKGVEKLFERRRLMVVGEIEDDTGSRVFLFIVLFAFVGTLLVLGG